MHRLEQLESEVRDLVVEIGHERFARRAWYRIVAALDNLGDTTLALKSYQQAGLGQTPACRYLRLFGLLQGVYMQQDSISFLYKALLGRVPHLSTDSAWRRIRELRNRIGGHPAERAGAVARITIEPGRFLIQYWDDKRDSPESEHVDFSSLYCAYRDEAVDTVKRLLQELVDPCYEPPRGHGTA